MNRRQFVAGAFGIIGIIRSSPAQVSNNALAGLHAVQPPTDFPDFTLPDVDGKTIRRSDLLGNVLILRFWATW